LDVRPDITTKLLDDDANDFLKAGVHLRLFFLRRFFEHFNHNTAGAMPVGSQSRNPEPSYEQFASMRVRNMG
jgi:hypothetical protein